MKLPPRLWLLLTHPRTKSALKIGSALTVLGAALFYPVVNWWGHRCLEKEVAACRVEGLPTTFRELLEPPPEQDLFEDPEIQAELKVGRPHWLVQLPGKRLPGLLAESHSLNWDSQPGKGRLHCVSDWFDPPKRGVSEAKSAREVLDLLRTDSERFDRIKTRMLETPADWAAEYRKEGQLEHPGDRLYFAARLVGFVRYRATLELAAGETEEACRDVLWMLGMEKRLVEEWRINDFGYFTGEARLVPIWEGVVRQAWTEEQLAAIQRKLGDIDYGRLTWPANNAELAARLYWVEEASKEPGHRKSSDWREWGRRGWQGFKDGRPGEVGQALSQAAYSRRPWGWDLALVAGCISDMRALRKSVVPGKQLAAADWKKLQALDDPGFGLLWMTRVSGTKAAYGEQRRLATLVGLSAERYRLKHGKMPERLEELVPEFLTSEPVDPMDGNPLRYKKGADGFFRVIGGERKGLEGSPRVLWTAGEHPFTPGVVTGSGGP